MTRLLPLGARRVRLENGHVITVLPSLDGQAAPTRPGDSVAIEIRFNQLRGWRLARRPDSASKKVNP